MIRATIRNCAAVGPAASAEFNNPAWLTPRLVTPFADCTNCIPLSNCNARAALFDSRFNPLAPDGGTAAHAVDAPRHGRIRRKLPRRTSRNRLRTRRHGNGLSGQSRGQTNQDKKRIPHSPSFNRVIPERYSSLTTDCEKEPRQFHLSIFSTPPAGLPYSKNSWEHPPDCHDTGTSAHPGQLSLPFATSQVLSRKPRPAGDIAGA